MREGFEELAIDLCEEVKALIKKQIKEHDLQEDEIADLKDTISGWWVAEELFANPKFCAFVDEVKDELIAAGVLRRP